MPYQVAFSKTSITTEARIIKGVNDNALPNARYHLIASNTPKYTIEKAPNPSSTSEIAAAIKGQPVSKAKSNSAFLYLIYPVSEKLLR
jgi:hypothetical protein